MKHWELPVHTDPVPVWTLRLLLIVSAELGVALGTGRRQNLPFLLLVEPQFILLLFLFLADCRHWPDGELWRQWPAL